MPDRHQMILSGCAESGAEEWVCPSCGRRVLLRWPPDYQKLVLERGDVTAIHVGGKGGVQVTEVVLAPAPAATDGPSAMDGPATDAPATDAPATDAPATEAPATGTLATEMPSAERRWLRDNGIDWDGEPA